jgi:hypothetical protein
VPRLSQTSRISHLESRILYIYIYIYTINEHTFQSFRPENNNKSSSKLYLKSQAADGHKGNKSALRHEYMSMSMFTAALVTTSTSKFIYLYPTISSLFDPTLQKLQLLCVKLSPRCDLFRREGIFLLYWYICHEK